MSYPILEKDNFIENLYIVLSYEITFFFNLVCFDLVSIASNLICLRSFKKTRKEGNVLFNDTLNTFYLQLYGIRHMVKDHSDSEKKPAAATCATLSD